MFYNNDSFKNERRFIMKKQSIKKMLMLGLAGISLATVGAVASQAPTVSASTVTTTKKAAKKMTINWPNRIKAIKEAKKYAITDHLSKKMTSQLLSGTNRYIKPKPTFSKATTKYALGQLKINWDVNAALLTKELYQENGKLPAKNDTKSILIKFGLFTPKQAEYAINNLPKAYFVSSKKVVPNAAMAVKKTMVQRRNALKMANEYANVNHLSMAGTYMATKAYYSKYPTAVIKYAINHVKANWNKNALYAAKKYKKIVKMTNKQIYNQLINGDRFNETEAKYAISHL